MTRSKYVFNHLYKSAQKPEDLPWYEEKPLELLVAALDRRGTPGTALDVGCGAGTYSVYMAKRGYRVTAIDFMPQALAMLQQQIDATDMPIKAIRADVGTWTTEEPFDVVLDVGCLHTPGTIEPEHYKRQLLNWLAPGGDFVLVHLGRRGWWDCWPIGPKRTYTQTVIDWFAPELELVEERPTVLSGLPLLVGRSMLSGRFWFRRRN